MILELYNLSLINKTITVAILAQEACRYNHTRSTSFEALVAMEDRQHITTPLRPTRPKIQYLGKAHGGRGHSTPRILVPATNPLTHPMRPLTQSIDHHHDDASQINMTFCEETGEIFLWIYRRNDDSLKHRFWTTT